MQIVLIKDVKGIGRAHEKVTTADGYALNYLIPRKLAVAATPQALKEAEVRRAQTIARRELDAKLFAQNLAALGSARVVVKAKANEKGHLYDAVGPAEIVAAAHALHIDLPEDAIRIERPFKEVGTHKVPVAFGEAFGEFPLTIEAE